jgi:predicted Zn-ribbon and HTH transcriptional regulator
MHNPLDFNGEILYDAVGDPAWLHCPGCGFELKIDERAVWVRCPKCETQVSLEQG